MRHLSEVPDPELKGIYEHVIKLHLMQVEHLAKTHNMCSDCVSKMIVTMLMSGVGLRIMEVIEEDEDTKAVH